MRWWGVAGFIAVLSLSGCTGTPAEDSNFCAGAPPADWQTFGHGFVTQNCETCHSSTSENRESAPSYVFFDTAEEVWTYKDAVLTKATGDSPTMPPLGGTTADDRYLLQVWLTCGVEGQ